MSAGVPDASSREASPAVSAFDQMRHLVQLGAGVVAALEREGIAYDSYLRDLREGFFYFQNSALYEDAEQKQFEAFTRAFEAVLGESEDHAWDLEPGRLDGFEPASVAPELAPRAPRPNSGYAGDHWNPSDAGWR